MKRLIAWIALLSSSLWSQDPGIVTVTWSEQSSFSDIKQMKRMHLKVYSLTVCSDAPMRLPAGRVVQEMQKRKLSLESASMVPILRERAKAASWSTYALTGLDVASEGVAAGVITGALGPWGAAVPLAVLVSKRYRSRQERVDKLIDELMIRYVRTAEEWSLTAVRCEEDRFIVTGASGWGKATQFEFNFPRAESFKSVGWNKSVEFVPEGN